VVRVAFFTQHLGHACTRHSQLANDAYVSLFCLTNLWNRAMFKYRPLKAMQVSLRLLDYEIKNDVHAEVLDVLGRGIKAAATRIDRATETGPDEYADAVTNTEIEIVEGLLGTAYVVCQSRITAIAQAALRCRTRIISDGLMFAAFGDRDHEVRRLGPRFDAQRSKVELLWAFANYFKHRDEWTSDSWTNPQGLERHTVPAILSAGLEPRSNGNLRTGAEALGGLDNADISVLQTVIREWADQIREEIRQTAGL
jgi:hypothetical protein